MKTLFGLDMYDSYFLKDLIPAELSTKDRLTLMHYDNRKPGDADITPSGDRPGTGIGTPFRTV